MSFPFPTIVLALLLVAGCAPVSQRWVAKSEASAANHQMMLVRNDPGSYGYRRLMLKAEYFPDLGIFLEDKGLPDFMAETSNRDRQYLIFYYLERHQAFACRAKRSPSRELEFSGPYPITEREHELLDGARKEAAAARTRGPV